MAMMWHEFCHLEWDYQRALKLNTLVLHRFLLD